MQKARPITQTYGSTIQKYHVDLDAYISTSAGSHLEKAEQFPKYTPRESMTKFLARYELFKLALHVPGSIVEGGVYHGGGMLAFGHFSAILEPTNFQRLIVGFDTFEGYPSIHDEDRKSTSDIVRQGGFSGASYSDLQQCIELFDRNRFLGHIAKLMLVKGDATKTIPAYIEEHPSTLVSLLYLDFNLYEPTRVALEQFLPRMPKGAIVVFDELNDPRCPGETRGLMDSVGIRNMRIQRFNFEPRVSYVVLE